VKIEIKNRFTGEVIVSGDYGSLAEAVVKSGANLSRANLSRADLFGANLFGANLSGADLSGANLSGANLSEADLSRAKLFGAKLSEANLSEADLSGANLSGANLSGANLSEAKNMDIYLQIGPVGSGHRFLVYNATKKLFGTGCFSGTKAELLKAVKEKHAKTEHLKPYLLAIKSLEDMAKLVSKLPVS
jgi:Pentapeptide repeats (8 copies)